ncbi:MAG TPA: Uma2 family endonuclease [Thermoanaerobaculia bacterium]|nr:Uma2 family endonuclease [Thermoanaerobaculia bacterium]
MSILPREQEIEYPSSDGQPMAETPQHAQVMYDLIFGLREWYAPVSDVWVAGNLFLYYEKGNPRARVAPDLLVAKGVKKWDRPNYQVWEDGPPALVVEVTSKKTRRKDQDVKKPLYERLGIKECVLFDPLAEYLRPSLQGFRLLRGSYQPIPLEADGSLRSQTTGLWLKREGQRLRLVEVATGERLLWAEEKSAAHAEAEAKAAEEAAARQAAEARAAEASAARQAAEAKAAEESAVRHDAEERIRALEAELKRLRKG